MTTKYEQVKSVHDRAVETRDANVLRGIPSLLKEWEISPRDDGQLQWINLSKPTSVKETITIGLRYIKRDQTFTEDIFELNNKKPDEVAKYYKGKYEQIRPEYKGTHKLQNVGTQSFTSVNTYCLYLGGKNVS